MSSDRFFFFLFCCLGINLHWSWMQRPTATFKICRLLHTHTCNVCGFVRKKKKKNAHKPFYMISVSAHAANYTCPSYNCEHIVVFRSHIRGLIATKMMLISFDVIINWPYFVVSLFVVSILFYFLDRCFQLSLLLMHLSISRPLSLFLVS